MLARAFRALHTVSTLPGGRWLIFTALAAVATWPWLKTAGAFNLFRDAQVLWLYEDAARRSVLDFGQFPLWNPDFCGGFPALGTPQSRFGSPLFLLTLLFGTTRAEPVTIFVLVLTALWGTFHLARAHGASALSATLAAPLFGLMGVFACAPFLGWFGFLGFAFLPWLLHGLRQAAQGEIRGAVWSGLATMLMVGFGGTYVAPISLVACLVEVLLLLVQRRPVRWSYLTLAALLAVGLSAFRLWPVWEELHRGPRVIAGLSAVGLEALGANLFGGWPILSSETWYLVTIPGAIAASLALLSRRGRWLAVPMGLWLWLAAGTAVSPSLYAALRTLPVFSLLRSSERFLVPAVLTLAIAAAVGLTRAQAHLRKRPFHRLSWAPSAVGLAAIALAVPWQLANFKIAAERRALSAPPREVHQPFHQTRGNRWAAAAFGPASRGSLACWEAYGLPQSPALRADSQREAWLQDESTGSLEEHLWSPNRLSFLAQLQRPTRLIINQNYHRGWKTNAGTLVNENGLLAVELPAGTHELQLRFLPTSALGGLLVSALALGVAALWWRTRLSLLQLAISAVTPLVVGAAVALASSEPPLPSTDPVGPEGEALVAQELPPDSQPLHVEFEGQIRLEGASVGYRPDDNRVRVELDWSHGVHVNGKLGVFVHVEPGTLKRITGDHLQLSDGLYLEQVPPGAIGRDIMLIDVPPSKRGVQWNVWVGLWEMRGDGSRVRVIDARGAQVADHRILAGSVMVPPSTERGQ